jgi:hypothetical protein
MKLANWLFVLLMCTCMGRATTLTFQDTFDDGVRDKSFWIVEKDDAILRETNGHLYGYSASSATPDMWPKVTWRMKTALLVAPNQAAEVQAQFRFPAWGVIPTNRYAKLAIGWTSLAAYSNRMAAAVVINYPKEREFAIALKPLYGYSVYAKANEPAVGNKFWLKLRYHSGTGKATLWFKADINDPWKQFRSFDMNGFWKVPMGTALFLKPFVQFETQGNNYNSPGPFFLDNFTAQLIYN